MAASSGRGLELTASDDERDDLDEFIAERTARNPEFPRLLAAAMRERALLRALAARRVERGLSQREVAAKMATSQAAVARLERAESDPRLSTLERYALAAGQRLEWRLVSDEEPAPIGNGE